MIDPHTHQYLDRLKDEPVLLALAAKTCDYLRRAEDMPTLARLSLRRLEHFYHKTSAVYNAMKALTIAQQREQADSAEVHCSFLLSMLTTQPLSPKFQFGLASHMLHFLLLQACELECAWMVCIAATVRLVCSSLPLSALFSMHNEIMGDNLCALQYTLLALHSSQDLRYVTSIWDALHAYTGRPLNPFSAHSSHVQCFQTFHYSTTALVGPGTGRGRRR